jgi:hypothetical protein
MHSQPEIPVSAFSSLSARSLAGERVCGGTVLTEFAYTAALVSGILQYFSKLQNDFTHFVLWNA